MFASVIIMKKIIPLCIAAALTLSACSSADEAADSAQNAASEASSAASSAADGDSKEGKNGKGGESRVVDTELGKVEVPANVESVVVLTGTRDLDIALSLGLPVTGYPKRSSRPKKMVRNRYIPPVMRKPTLPRLTRLIRI